MTKTKRGGAREGAGRPKSDDPRITISVRLQQSLIDKIGDDRTAKIERAVKNYLKIKN